MAETQLDVGSDGRKIGIEIDLFNISVRISKYSSLNEGARTASYQLIENIHSYLSEKINKSYFEKGENHKIRAFSIKDRNTLYIFYQGTISISSISIKRGSIKLNVAFSFAVLASVYSGISDYPSFKEGYRELKKDIYLGLEFLSESYEKFDLYLDGSISKQDEKHPGSNNEIILYIRSEEEIHEELIDRLRIALTHHEKH